MTADVVVHVSDGLTYLECRSVQRWVRLPVAGEEVSFRLPGSGEKLFLAVTSVEFPFGGVPVVMCRMTRHEAANIPALREMGFKDAEEA